MVFDGDVAIAWAEYGPVEELENIHHRKEWEQGVDRCRTIASPACSSTADTGARAWRRLPFGVRWR